MKRTSVIAVLTALLASCGNQSETTSETVTTSDTSVKPVDSGKVATTVTTTTTTTTTLYTAEEGDVMWKNGKLLIYKNGGWILAKRDITFDDGTVISLKGNVTNKDGKMISINEGESVKKTGEFFNKAGNAISNAWDATKEGVKDAGKAIKEGAEDAGEAIKEGAKKVSDKTKKVVDSLRK